MDNESATAISIKIWEKVIEVQMHFNDHCLRVRNFAVYILGVLLGAAALSYRFGGHASIFGISFHTSEIFFYPMIIWLAFFLMD